MDRDSGWRQLMIASAMKGAVFGVVKATTDRAGATGFAYLTGTWPGNDSANQKAKKGEIMTKLIALFPLAGVVAAAVFFWRKNARSWESTWDSAKETTSWWK
jgi:hypothetical protein